ncbi:hypothetical protein MPER_03927, partial [Moniliophthora perniciosa FA553]
GKVCYSGTMGDLEVFFEGWGRPIGRFKSSGSIISLLYQLGKILENGRDMGKTGPAGQLLWKTLILSERSAINYARNLLAYGVRAGMYAAMANVS